MPFLMTENQGSNTADQIKGRKLFDFAMAFPTKQLLTGRGVGFFGYFFPKSLD